MDFDFSGAANPEDSAGAGAPSAPPPQGIPSVAAQPSPAAPGPDPRLAAVMARLNPQPQPVDKWTQALRTILPMIGALGAMHNNAGGAYINEFQNIEKQRQQQASARTEDDVRLATILHQQEMERTAAKREADTAAQVAQRQAELRAKEAATEARQRATDTYNFLNKQAQNPNWTQSTLDLVNKDPKNIDKLSVSSPWGENIPLRKIVDLGFISQNPTTGQYEVKTKKGPRHVVVNDAASDSKWDVMLDPETNQEVSRTYLGSIKDPYASQASKMPHFLEPKEGVGPHGEGTGEFQTFNTATGAFQEVPPVVNRSGKPIKFSTKAANPQYERAKESAGYTSKDLARTLDLVDNAEKLLGPAIGRYYEFLAGTVKSTGDAKLDEQLGGLRDALLNIKTTAGTALTGTTRAGGSSGIMGRYDQVLGTNGFTAAALRGALKDMKIAVDERAGDKAAPTTINHTMVWDPVAKAFVEQKQ